MAYIAEKPNIVPPIEELRAKIPGWGVDLDPSVRPAVPKEQFNPRATGAHWEFPEAQPENYPRERSPEHAILTPVFGTVCPPKGISGVVRRYAYRLSEGRLAHWLLLVVADRIDLVESRIGALLKGRPDNLLQEAGLKAEVKRHGLRARVGRRRADVKHLPIEVIAFALPRVVLAGAVLSFVQRSLKTRRRRQRRSWRALLS